ncbi:helix-turn-helix domain-containing protein (plasmid) [Haladaptatus sp. SPP-AMP-3]|uniref:ArsR/SmtB family transcription factor n=1 Tax=Haladaptatus sp. SPP-AMP-3 TaxID=3121295 RepID=UPI003C2D5D70
MSKEWGPDDIFDVLASGTAREILLLSSSAAMSAQQLAEECGASKPTVYRRINKLHEYDLLEQKVVIDERGNHYNTYRTNMDRICFEISDNEFVVTIRFDEDLIDRFVSAWTGLKGTENGVD